MKIDLTSKVFEIIASLAEVPGTPINVETSLIGENRVLDSIKLVELCVELEDLASEHGFVFDWTSETAMSRSRSMFRTAGALADELANQQSACAQ